MGKFKKVNIAGDVLGEEEWSLVLKKHPSATFVKNYINIKRKNQMQRSANTQVRPEVNHSGKKPRKQKGTGRARQGYLGSPQFKGGYVVHGPRPKSVRFATNKKERRNLFGSLLTQKMDKGLLYALDESSLQTWQVPSTKQVQAFVDSLSSVKKKVLFIVDHQSDAISKEALGYFKKSISNVPKAFYTDSQAVSSYDLMYVDHVVAFSPVIDSIKKQFEGVS